MATINPLFGRMKGKYGGSVMYSNNGKQCMRERVLEVRNPRSSKQAIQRCIMATVNQFVTAFTPVLNNAIESETTKARNLAKIRSYNLNIVRQLAANGDGAYCPKGAQFVAPNDYQISRGTLRGMLPLRDTAARNYLANSGGLVFSASDLDAEDISLTASSVFPSVSVGDQITILASMTEDIAEGSLSAFCRFAFKNDVTPALITDPDGQGAILNPAAIDLTKADGDWQKLLFVFEPQGIKEASAILLGGLVLDASTNIQCAGVIVSREAERKRSTSYMVSKTPDEYLLDEVYPTYMDGGTAIDMPSEVYLNNDAQVTPSIVRYSGYATGSAPALPYSFAVSAGRLVVLTSKNQVPDGTTSLGTIKCSLNGVDYETTIEVETIGSSVVAHADIEGEGSIQINGLNAQGQQITLGVSSSGLAGLIINSINLTW